MRAPAGKGFWNTHGREQLVLSGNVRRHLKKWVSSTSLPEVSALEVRETASISVRHVVICEQAPRFCGRNSEFHWPMYCFSLKDIGVAGT